MCDSPLSRLLEMTLVTLVLRVRVERRSADCSVSRSVGPFGFEFRCQSFVGIHPVVFLSFEFKAVNFCSLVTSSVTVLSRTVAKDIYVYVYCDTSLSRICKKKNLIVINYRSECIRILTLNEIYPLTENYFWFHFSLLVVTPIHIYMHLCLTICRKFIEDFWIAGCEPVIYISFLYV